MNRRHRLKDWFLIAKWHLNILLNIPTTKFKGVWRIFYKIFGALTIIHLFVSLKIWELIENLNQSQHYKTWLGVLSAIFFAKWAYEYRKFIKKRKVIYERNK